MTGFQGLVKRQFGGDTEKAKRWVGDLGRASYFFGFRPGLARKLLNKWRPQFPIERYLMAWENDSVCSKRGDKENV